MNSPRPEKGVASTGLYVDDATDQPASRPPSLCPLSARADIYFPLYVPPLRSAAQSADQLLKGIGVFGGVLEPSQEVE